jgi:hypothetical protein
VGAIHGRVLTAWSTAAVIGPNMLAYLRNAANTDAINDLVGKVNPDTFQKTFNAPVSQLNQLVEAKTVTIARMMDIVPIGTADPTPMLYDHTMYGVAGMLSIAFLANMSMSPVSAKFWTGGDNKNAKSEQPQA